MLPMFPDRIEVEHIDADDLCVVWLDEAVEGVGDNRLYREIAEVSWEEVAVAIPAERELVALAAAGAVDGDDFDRRADQLVRDRYPGEWDDEGPLDEGPLTSFADLDLGVMSAVAALVAAGALTTTSCRGHYSSRGEHRPLVRFVCDDNRLPLISSAAVSAECGLHLDPQGMLQLYASDIEAFIRFAEQLAARGAAFDEFSMEGVFESMEVYGDLIDDHESESGLAYFSRRDLLTIRRRLEADRPIDGHLPLFGEE